MNESRYVLSIACLAALGVSPARATDPSGPRWVKVINSVSVTSDRTLSDEIRSQAAARAAEPIAAPVSARRVSAPTIPEARSPSFESVIKELADNVEACGVDRKKLVIGLLTGEEALRKSVVGAMKGYAKLEAALKADGIDLRYSYAKELAEKCALSVDAQRFNVGSVEVLRYAGFIVGMEKRGRPAVSVLNVEIGPLSGPDLYNANRAAQAVEAGGKKTLTLKVNAGDYEAGLSILDLLQKMYVSEPR